MFVNPSGVALRSGWVTLELCGTLTGATGTWDVYRNGTKIVNAWASSVPAGPSFGQIQIADTSARTMTVNFDDVVVDQSAG